MNLNLKTTILLTSSGGLTGIFLSKHLKKTTNYRIIGVDISNFNPIKKWVDAFYILPSLKDENYISKIKKIISDEKVDILIPVTSNDVNLFSQGKIKIQFKNIKMLIMDYNTHITLSNKKTGYEYLKTLGIMTPQIYQTIEDAEFPLILKPAVGSGSKDTVLINNIDDYNYWSNKINNYILVQFLEGKEYTVDCLFNKEGKCLGANVRERVKINGGGATVSINDYSINIERVITKLENTKKIKGPINFQFKQLSNGDIYLFDFNTRFASGGLPLTVESGFDIPNMLVNILQDKQVEKWIPNKLNNGLTMIKYYEEYYNK